MVTLSHGGYAKSQPVSDYRAQRRGGRGRAATAIKDEDFVDKLFVANTHDTLLCFSSRGQLYWLKVYQLPQAGRAARGKPIVNLLPLRGRRAHHRGAADPRVRGRQVRVHGHGHRHGQEDARWSRSRGRAPPASSPSSSSDGDQLVGVDITDGKRDVMLFTSGGKAIRFAEDDVRPMGRNAAGVRGIRLPEGERVISLIIADRRA